MEDFRIEVGIADQSLLHLGIVGEAYLVLETGIQLACRGDLSLAACQDSCHERVESSIDGERAMA